MKPNICVLFTLLIAGSLIACGPDGRKAESDCLFTREDFAESKELKEPEEIVLDSVLDPAACMVAGDSLLLVSSQPSGEFLLELYSLESRQPVARLVRKGNGPGEMTACVLNAHNGESPLFFLQDPATGICYMADLDSTLAHRSLHIISRFSYSQHISELADFCMVDERRYVACHKWYIEDEAYSNGIDSPLHFYSIGEQADKERRDYSYFVEPVNGTMPFVNPSTGQIWALDMHRDRITVYDDSLRSVRSLTGPDHFQPRYSVRKMPSPIPFIGFADGYEYRTYTDYFLTSKHIYLVYEGEEHFNLEAMNPVEVFKLDFRGNLLCRYQTDRHLYSISVDSKEEYLYGIARSSVTEEAAFVRYKI